MLPGEENRNGPLAFRRAASPGSLDSRVVGLTISLLMTMPTVRSPQFFAASFATGRRIPQPATDTRRWLVPVCAKKRFLAIALAICLGAGASMAAECDNVKKDSEILLVLWSADDCGYCQKWKGPLGGRRDLTSWSDYSRITYREVERRQKSASLTVEHFPADLKWLFDRMARSGHLRTGPVPAWTLYVDKVEVEQAYGLSKWGPIIFPLLKELVAEKIALQEHATAAEAPPKN